ncbi:MAG: hypothetical protein WB771_02390 [Solirubrobacterales bacterium]
MVLSLRRRSTPVLLAALALAALATAPASVEAATFGADLNRIPNNTGACQNFGYGSITCSAESIDLSTGESNFPPAGNGVVTQVRVRVGPTTAPMQIVVEEALRKDNPADPGHPTYACCKAINASSVFTPAANSITPVAVNLPVKQDLAPEASGYYVDDHLSLSVLDPSVPIPANLDANASDGLWFPAWQVGQERAGIYGTAGAMILFNADWTATSSAPGTGGDLVELARTARVQGNHALFSVLCNLSVPCRGNVKLQNLNARLASLAGPQLLGTASARARIKTYAKGKLKIPAGKKRTVRVALNGRGRRLLRGRRRARVWAKVTLTGQAPIPPTRLKLKR